MKLLFTGFAPFGGLESNPSWDCLNMLPRQPGWFTACLPVSFRRGPEALMAAVERCRPDGVVCFGLAASRTKITPEKVAVNFAHARIPDNDGAQPQNLPLDPRGPAAYFSTLPVLDMVEALEAKNIPAELSLSAGSYVCNAVMYRLLAWATPRGIPAGFVHVPGNLPPAALCQAVEIIAHML